VATKIIAFFLEYNCHAPEYNRHAPEYNHRAPEYNRHAPDVEIGFVDQSSRHFRQF
jgi:hypothetical protein